MRKYYIKTIILVSLISIISFLAYYLFPRQKSIEVINPEAPIEKKDYEPELIFTDSPLGKKEMIQIKFSWVVDGISYNDAINVSKEEYNKMSDKDIESMKTQRINAWINLVNVQSNKY